MENLRWQQYRQSGGRTIKGAGSGGRGTLPTQIREATEIRPLALGTRPASRGLPIVHGTQA
jgi:hypothetical protein